jgi:hypothetical protein
MPSITTQLRVEPQAREATMKRCLQAQVRDPLWMLARQWQVGEFLGKDSGSPAQATFQVESINLTSYQPSGGKIVPLDGNLPLETHIEREAVTLGLRGAVQLGLYFEILMTKAGLADGITAFRKAYPIASKPPPDELPDNASLRYRIAVAGRVTDGNALFSAARSWLAGQHVTPPLPLPGRRRRIRQVLQDFVDYRTSLYSEPLHDSAWIDEQMEYQFAVGAQSSGEDIALSAPEYRGGHVDWYSFSLSNTPIDAGNPTTVQVQDRAILPTHVSFKGMPNSRWWNFEDSSVELVDLAKKLVMEFALVYSNDWFNVPVPVPYGSLNKVKLLIVSDTFGERTLIRPTLEMAPRLQQPWNMFTIGKGDQRLDHLFVPPSLDPSAILEGIALEDVLFLRDDMAAIGWAVEESLQGPLDGPISGHESSLQRNSQMTPPGPPHTEVGGAQIYYLLGTSVPDNWIPLVPILTPNQQRYFRRGKIGRIGVNHDQFTAHAMVLKPGVPLFIKDQTVSRVGTEVRRYFRRIRWKDGSTFVWMARETSPGRGPGWSGLAFDLIRPIGQITE